MKILLLTLILTCLVGRNSSPKIDVGCKFDGSPYTPGEMVKDLMVCKP